jgi:CRP-like cAMP-binding protein
VSQIDLKAFSLLAAFEPAEREALREVLEELHLDGGTVLFEEGEPGDGLLFVVEGGVRIQSSRDEEAVTLSPGASLGAFSLVVSGKRETGAETTSRSHILVLRRSAFRRFCETDPRAACRLLEAILGETARLSREALEVRARVGVSDVEPTRSDVDPRDSDD